MPLTRYEHVSGSAREHARNVVAEQYAAGATVRMIADDLGRSYGFVHRLLLEAGVELRSRGARSRTAHGEVPGQLEIASEIA